MAQFHESSGSFTRLALEIIPPIEPFHDLALEAQLTRPIPDAAGERRGQELLTGDAALDLVRAHVSLAVTQGAHQLRGRVPDEQRDGVHGAPPDLVADVPE